ncbi:FtsQ-type POTRA domain-containing protein [Apilactobacillus apisilvae]|uniref:Cell division protein DivIB n=1 Tax=Apilactobacillus apisilvae TaxID=2923364 RepID=A0ABY4PJC2_9LACO|nr:FtsQ-type POTRA domain-containing protein [Apilactobacillus apisilvae]UQS85546.1 FtsQ-type POTRA domain-containing protein [Apilactobacillus apisilvae]
MKDFLQDQFKKFKNYFSNLFKNISFKDEIKKSIDKFFNLFKKIKIGKIKFKLKKTLIIFIPLIFALIFLTYLISPLSKFDSVQIDGNGYIPKNYVKKLLNVNTGDSIFKVVGHRKKIVNKLLDNDHRIKSVSIRILSFNKLIVQVRPYKEIGYETRGLAHYLILENGSVSNSPIDNPNDIKLPYIVNFKDRDNLKSIIDKYMSLPKDIRDNIRVISYAPTKVYPDELHIYMRDGNKVLVLLSNFSYKMQFYRSIATKLKYKSIINMEVGAYSYPINKQK